MKELSNYIIIEWPDCIEYTANPDWNDHATIIAGNSSMGISDSTYLVDKDWFDIIKK